VALPQLQIRAAQETALLLLQTVVQLLQIQVAVVVAQQALAVVLAVTVAQAS
jgi:hypothetical protein